MGRRAGGRRGRAAPLLAAAAVAAVAATAVAAAVAVAAVPASAHPFTDETMPARFSSAPVGTSEVIVRYSESVEIGHSSLEVFDSDGERVDNGDTSYYGDGDAALIVTTAPLGEGVYTVASKVLSRVDGHLVPSAFVFGVGGAVVEDPAAAGGAEERDIGDLIFFEQAGARFPGLAGQTVVLGAVISSLLVWAGAARRHDAGGDEEVAAAVHSRTMTLIGIGLVAVLASNMIMLAVQMVSLDASAAGVLQTSFGSTWIVRMGLTAALIGAWFAAERRRRQTLPYMMPLLALSLALIATTTMMGHGMASGEPAAAALDYLHNLVAAAWIGGVAYLAFALLPALRGRGGAGGDALMLAAASRFTMLAAASIGIVVVSGPVLMWMLDGDMGDVAGSAYGRLIMAKIGLALAMVAIAAHHHRVRAAAVRALAGGGRRLDVLGRMGPGLRAEAAVGMALIGVVALLSNSTLPDGEIQLAGGAAAAAAAAAGAGGGPAYAGLSAVEYTDGAAFGVEIRPFAPGANTVRVAVAGHDGGPLGDLEGVKVKVSNPLRGISPIEVPVRAGGAGGDAGEEGEAPGGIEAYEADVSFGFPGEWQLEIEALRSGSANEALAMGLAVKPRLADVDARVAEYEFPDGAGAPLFPQYDPATGMIWITDASAPAIWGFSPAGESFERHPFGGQASIALDVDPSDGTVWFTDVAEGRIGYVDPSSNRSEAVEFPKIVPVLERNIAVAIDADGTGGVWAAIINKGVVARYDRATGEFDLHRLPGGADAAPFGIASDPGRGIVWIAQQGPGTIARLDAATGKIVEVAPAWGPLMTPETLTVAPDGSLWVSEHREGGAIARYDPLLGSFERVPAPDPAAFPNSAALDRYGNVWFAMHTVDKIGVHDPLTGEVASIPVPSAGSWVQFMTTDGDGDVWFVEQGTAKLGRISVGYAPPAGGGGGGGGDGDAPPSGAAAGDWPEPRYSEVAGPLMAAGIVAASLMAVRGVRDRREADEAVEAAAGAAGGSGP